MMARYLSFIVFVSVMWPNEKTEPPPNRDVDRDSGTDSANGSGDFHEKAVKWNICCTWFFYSEWAALARQERIALPSELAVASGSRLDPMSLQQEECDHLVIGLALRRLRRRTVITPRSASIPVLLLKAFLFSGSSRRQHQSRRGGHARLVVRAVFPEAQ